MIEKTLYDYLNSQLSVPVFTEYPDIPSTDYPTLPTEYAVIDKITEDVADYIRYAQMVIYCYSTQSKYNAVALNETVKSVMDAMAENVETVSESRLNAANNNTDTSTKRYRSACYYNIYYYD